MCGIVAYIGEKDATPVIVSGLRKLEYRGYDSAGIAVLQNGKIEIRRVAGKIEKLEKLVDENPIKGNIGIGHTRWATHGAPNEQNAHPHVGMAGRIVIVHNGIVENYLSLREELIAEGVESETDTETIAHLIEGFYSESQDLYTAVQSALKLIKGAHGLVVMSTEEPDRLIAARLGNAGGVALGIGDGDMYLASDVPAIVEYTRRLGFLESGQVAIITKDGYSVNDLDGNPIQTEVVNVPGIDLGGKGRYRLFAKEIHEQVRSLSDTMSGRVDFEEHRIHLETLNLDEEKPNRSKHLYHRLWHGSLCRDGWQISDRKHCQNTG